MNLPKSGEGRAGRTFAAAPEAAFSWDGQQSLLARLPGGGLNIAHEAVDRHLAAGHGGREALRCIGPHHERRSLTYDQLAELTNRMAVVLADLGLRQGEVVASLLPRSAELYQVALGTWKAGGVFCPLSASFGPGPLRARLNLGDARVLVIGESLYRRKIAPVRAQLPNLKHVLLVGDNGGPVTLDVGCADFRALAAAADPARARTAATGDDDPAFLHFTSGTTGAPKGAVQPHRAVLAHRVTGIQVFDLNPDDIYWCTADPGWVTSTAYAIIAPLVAGCTAIVDEADFDPRRWYAILREEAVSVWYTTPTAIRMMMRFGAALARSYDYPALRLAASVGEPLNPEAVTWGEKALGVPFLDTWWQTETGAIAIANRPGTGRVGSMGRPLPGIEAAVVRHGPSGIEVITTPDEPGELALRQGFPSLFIEYAGDPARYSAAFRDGWYLTGDRVRQDADGWFWFVGRGDDMIKSGAQQIGPFEVEAGLLDHPAVAEIGVVGKPDPLLREVPVAFVSLNPGFEAGEALRLELLSFARQTLGAAMAPREIHFVESLPKTSTGKIIRRVLKQKALEDDDDDLVPALTLQPCPGRFDDE